jgi:hypothetical protein
MCKRTVHAVYSVVSLFIMFCEYTFRCYLFLFILLFSTSSMFELHVVVASIVMFNILNLIIEIVPNYPTVPSLARSWSQHLAHRVASPPAGFTRPIGAPSEVHPPPSPCFLFFLLSSSKLSPPVSCICYFILVFVLFLIYSMDGFLQLIDRCMFASDYCLY